MECDICDRTFDQTRRPFCPSCAQATLYEPRVRQVTALLDRENAHTHSEAIVRPGNDGVLAALPQDADWDAITSAVKKHGAERTRAEQERTEARIAAITQQADALRSQMEEHKRHIEDTKRRNENRREELATEIQQLAARRPQAVGPVQSARQKAAQRVERVHVKTVDARAYICRHSSSLNGIHQLRDAQGRHTGRYELNGLVLPKLKELNAAPGEMDSSSDRKRSNVPGFEHHDHVNACLDNICHLLGVWCHYLSIRLPAEIILPHSDFPHAAILSEKSSYKASNIPYPATLASHPSSPSASRFLQEQRQLPRPRLLHLDRPLSRLYKEDNKTFAMFVEGVVMLAWDIAWLCRSQGVTTINGFDDVCDIGRNIWLLAHAQQHHRRDREQEGKSRAVKQAGFGSFSHSNLRYCLVGNEGAAIMQDWRLSQPHRLVDKLRNHLILEITGAEWDVLDEDDFGDLERASAPATEGQPGASIDASTIFVGGSQGKSFDPAMSVISVAPQEARAKGESGWMKVRDRGAGGGT